MNTTNKQDETLPHILNNGLTDALEILVEELNKSSVRKYTCINGMAYSQLERDIVEKLTNWQKERDKVIIDKLLLFVKMVSERGYDPYENDHHLTVQDFVNEADQLLNSLK